MYVILFNDADDEQGILDSDVYLWKDDAVNALLKYYAEADEFEDVSDTARRDAIAAFKAGDERVLFPFGIDTPVVHFEVFQLHVAPVHTCGSQPLL